MTPTDGISPSTGAAGRRGRSVTRACVPLLRTALPRLGPGLVSAVLIAAPAMGAHAEEDPAALAKELARLRAEVEDLNARIDQEKEAMRTELRALETQKTDLALKIQKEELRVHEAERALERQRTTASAAGALEQAMRPTVDASITRLEGTVEDGLPFKVRERIDDLETLRHQVEEGLVSPIDAVARLWERVEDELRLARETGLYQQVVRLGDEEVLADVAKVGMVMLFFRTRDGRYGYAVKGKGGWSYRLAGSDTAAEEIAGLFDALKKQIRVGYFELPGALAPTEIDTGAAQ